MKGDQKKAEANLEMMACWEPLRQGYEEHVAGPAALRPAEQGQPQIENRREMPPGKPPQMKSDRPSHHPPHHSPVFQLGKDRPQFPAGQSGTTSSRAVSGELQSNMSASVPFGDKWVRIPHTQRRKSRKTHSKLKTAFRSRSWDYESLFSLV